MSNEKTYDLLLRQFVGQRLISTFNLLVDLKHDTVLECADLMAQGLFLKRGSDHEGLPTWLNYFDDGADVQMLMVIHDTPALDVKIPEQDTKDSITNRVLGEGVFKYERIFSSLLSSVIGQTARQARESGFDHHSLPIYSKIMEVLVEYTFRRTVVSLPVKWNVPGRPGRETSEFLMAGYNEDLVHAVKNCTPVFAHYCKDHPAVRPVSYDEVNSLIGTSGCSREEPYWAYSVMGKIETSRGVQLVCPGDWIVEPIRGVYQILTDEQYTVFLSNQLSIDEAELEEMKNRDS